MKIEYYKGGFVNGDEEMFLKPVVKILDARLSAFNKNNQHIFKSRYSSLKFLISSNECTISVKDEYMKINDIVINEMSEAIGEVVEMIENTDLNSLKEDYKKMNEIISSVVLAKMLDNTDFNNLKEGYKKMNEIISSVVLAKDPKAKIINRDVEE